MKKVFGIMIEFDRGRICRTIEGKISECAKGYVCIVDSNVLSLSYKDRDYRGIINNATMNTCDGSSIALLASLIYNTELRTFSGPELFSHYILNEEYEHLLLGSTKKVADGIISSLKDRGLSCKNINYMQLPFCSVEQFDYERIADRINDICPDFIWVSLGAPKQERFMACLVPFLDRGLMFGVGAAFKFFTNELHASKKHIGPLKFVWLGRILREPRKQLCRVERVVSVYPVLIYQEVKRARGTKAATKL